MVRLKDPVVLRAKKSTVVPLGGPLATNFQCFHQDEDDVFQDESTY